MVAGYHHHSNPGLCALGERLRYVTAQRVRQTQQAAQFEIEVPRRIRQRRARKRAARDGQDPQSTVGASRRSLEHAGARIRRQSTQIDYCLWCTLHRYFDVCGPRLLPDMRDRKQLGREIVFSDQIRFCRGARRSRESIGAPLRESRAPSDRRHRVRWRPALSPGLPSQDRPMWQRQFACRPCGRRFRSARRAFGSRSTYQSCPLRARSLRRSLRPQASAASARPRARCARRPLREKP